MSITSAIAGTGRAIWTTYRLGGRTLVLAPAILAIVMLPEFAQHVAEIHLGMFDSLEDARRLANDPLRWSFGYAKVAGVVIAILATARFWALGSVRRALLPRPRALLRIAIAIAMTFIAALPFEWAKQQGLPAAANVVLTILSVFIQAGLTVYVTGTLLEDEEASLRDAFTRGLPTALLLTLLVALAFGPAQALHMANHRIALGQPDAILWAIMVFDSVLVGLLTALVGAALFVGYRAGPTWRGWRVAPGQIEPAGRVVSS